MRHLILHSTTANTHKHTRPLPILLLLLCILYCRQTEKPTEELHCLSCAKKRKIVRDMKSFVRQVDRHKGGKARHPRSCAQRAIRTQQQQRFTRLIHSACPSRRVWTKRKRIHPAHSPKVQFPRGVVEKLPAKMVRFPFKMQVCAEIDAVACGLSKEAVQNLPLQIHLQTAASFARCVHQLETVSG